MKLKNPKNSFKLLKLGFGVLNYALINCCKPARWLYSLELRQKNQTFQTGFSRHWEEFGIY